MSRRYIDMGISKISDNPDTEDDLLIRRLFECAGEAVYTWDIAGDSIEWYPEAADILGVELGRLPATPREFIAQLSPDDAPRRAVQFSNHTHRGLPYRCEFKFRRDGGRYHWVEERVVFDCNASGKSARAIGMLRVIDESRRQHGELEWIAHHDELTGLPNRARIAEILDTAAGSCAASGVRAAYLLVNVDRISLINASYGFDMGDAVLVETARRIEYSLRIGDSVGRVGGNQFGVVMFDTNENEAEVFAHKLLSRFRGNEIETEPGPIGVTVSIGVVELHDAEIGHRGIQGRAEEALALAKSSGRDRFATYMADPDKEKIRQLALKTGRTILRAYNEQRLDFAVQPVVDSATGTPAFYECLMRISNENGNILPAASFIPAAEQFAIVRKLDRYMIERVLQELDQNQHISLAVNVSAMTVTDATMLSYIQSMVHAHHAVAERLIFEITETMAMYEFTDTARFISKIRDLGCRIAIDDFGAGFSSFRHLKDLPVDLIKIDGQFIKGMTKSAQSQLFVDTLLGLANGLGIPVVAECVESEADAAALKTRNVAYLQGYYYGEPSMQRPWEETGLRLQG